MCSLQFSARFIPELVTISDPLWKLVREKIPWQWGEAEEKAFEAVKAAISTKCMAYFNKDWCTEVEVDASPCGLGAVIYQYNPKDKSQRFYVCFASRLLSEVERRYSQCEKEALAVVWACERFWLYLFGKRFTLITDNRAIKLIMSNTRSRPPARIERLALRLSQFDYVIEHRPGKIRRRLLLASPVQIRTVSIFGGDKKRAVHKRDS